jgi:hypothetical protein
MDNYKRWKNGKAYKFASFILFDEYGPKNCKIVLVEAFQCNSKDELKAREKYYIDNFECVNKNIPEIIRDEYNKDEMNEHIKKYQKNLSEKCACECGGKYIMLNKNVHFRSKKHLKYINGENV